MSGKEKPSAIKVTRRKAPKRKAPKQKGRKPTKPADDRLDPCVCLDPCAEMSKCPTRFGVDECLSVRNFARQMRQRVDQAVEDARSVLANSARTCRDPTIRDLLFKLAWPDGPVADVEHKGWRSGAAFRLSLRRALDDAPTVAILSCMRDALMEAWK